ncbi:interleukin-26 isoform X2 [Nothobranchius furzeri]|uniref:interleukin-26 isoform X2 n=1 Tax=Nothobranchius furzeri TaxID=105023 RepID=UPI003904BF67
MMQKAMGLQYFNMSLITVRISAFSLLIVLIAMATAEQGLTCREEIPVELIRELWNGTRMIQNKLPKEDRLSRRVRLLPHFCTTCPERVIGWLELQEMIDVYEKSVFNSELVQKFVPHHYNELLDRLHHTLQHCVSYTEPSEHFKDIKKMERRIQKKGDEGALKAVREFNFILRWIDELL